MSKQNLLACFVNIKFEGIYAIGDGWSSETAEKWYETLRNEAGIHWHITNDHWGSQYAVSTEGGFFVHPEGFRFVLNSCGGSCPRGRGKLDDYFGSKLDSIKHLCEKLCEVCGGTYTMEVSLIEQDVEMREW